MDLIKKNGYHTLASFHKGHRLPWSFVINCISKKHIIRIDFLNLTPSFNSSKISTTANLNSYFYFKRYKDVYFYFNSHEDKFVCTHCYCHIL